MKPQLALLKDALLAVGLMLLWIVGLALLAVLAIALRPLLIVLFVGGAIAAQVLDHYSPRFHSWFQAV